MARSIAAQAPGRVGAGARAGAKPRGGLGSATLVDRALGLPAAAADALRSGFARAWQRPRARVALIAVAIALPVLAGAWLWFRSSPFAAVQRVTIVGVSGYDAAAVEADLERAAHGMSTLDVSDGALRASVAPLGIVRELRATASFPHTLRIQVVEQLPVANLTAAGVHTAVAADGVVLGPGLLSSALPSISASVVPAPGHHVSGANVLAELAVLGAAPAPLARHVERVFTGAKGITVAMRNGLQVYFGDDWRALAKWLSLARVLADPSSAGASYIDVRLPSHPAAGFPAGVTPPDAATNATGTSTELTAGTESAIAALAAALPGGSSGSSTASGSGSSTPSETTSEPSSGASSGSSAPTSTTSTGASTPSTEQQSSASQGSTPGTTSSTPSETTSTEP
jgi:cell division protein FtsQ